MQGKVKLFNKEMGYGFITAEGQEKDIFFHYSELVMEGFKIIENDAVVEFELVQSERGPQAKKIVKVQ